MTKNLECAYEMPRGYSIVKEVVPVLVVSHQSYPDVVRHHRISVVRLLCIMVSCTLCIVSFSKLVSVALVKWTYISRSSVRLRARNLFAKYSEVAL